MVLCKLSVSGRPTNLEWLIALTVGAGGGCLDFFSSLVYLFYHTGL